VVSRLPARIPAVNPRTKRILRYVVASIVGAGFGYLLTIGFLILVVLICIADGGGFMDLQANHKFVNELVRDAFSIIPILVPITGAILGLVWAYRKNKRDRANSA
jgi:hypothetical protein